MIGDISIYKIYVSIWAFSKAQMDVHLDISLSLKILTVGFYSMSY